MSLFTDDELNKIVDYLPNRLILAMFEYYRFTTVELTDLDLFIVPNEGIRLFNHSDEGKTLGWISILQRINAQGGLYQLLTSHEQARTLWKKLAEEHFHTHDPYSIIPPIMSTLAYQRANPQERYLRLARIKLIFSFLDLFKIDLGNDRSDFFFSWAHLTGIESARIETVKRKRVSLQAIEDLTPRSIFLLIHMYHIILDDILDTLADNKLKCGHMTTLIYVADKSHEITKLLLTRGADVNLAHTRTGETPLLAAARLQNTGNMRRLIAQGAQVNQADHEKITPLMMAVNRQHVEGVKLLLAAGADVTKTTDRGRTALKFAQYECQTADQKEILRLIQDAIKQQTSPTPPYSWFFRPAPNTTHENALVQKQENNCVIS